MTAEDAMFNMGICAIDQGAPDEIRELADVLEDEGNDELADELRLKAFELEYPNWC